MIRTALGLTAAALLLAGCATRGPTTVPTQLRSGQSWLITRPLVAAQVLDTCARDSPTRHPGEVTGYWAPSRQQIDQLEAAQARLQPVIASPASFDRQYVGIEVGGRRLIYINAFHLPDHSDLDPARTAVRVCDGGAGSWGAVYDPQSGEFSQVETNGPG
ncbi:MAG: hypothetical protein QM581_16405 [Pseudomonas sp.]